MDYLAAPRYPVVTTLPAAGSNTGRVFEQGLKLWFSDGTNWLELTAGAATGDFVDRTTNQTIGGEKTFTNSVLAPRFMASRGGNVPAGLGFQDRTLGDTYYEWYAADDKAYLFRGQGLGVGTLLSIGPADATFSVPVYAPLTHTRSYFNVYSYDSSDTYYDGSYFQAYYNGKARLLRVHSRDAANIAQPVLLDVIGSGKFSGGVTIGVDSQLSFGNSTETKLVLFAGYTQGIQDNTMYFRTGSPTVGAFAWFGGGVHSDTQYDPGTGGVNFMRLSAAGLSVTGSIESSGTKAEFVFRDRSTDRRWLWYGNGDLARLYNGASDIAWFNATGGFVNTGRLYVRDGPDMTPPATGVISMYYLSSVVGDYGVLLTYNYGTSTYKSMMLEAAEFYVRFGGTPNTGIYLNSAGMYLYNGWYRTHGAAGWYNQTYNGGWYMTDTSYVRSYANKVVAAPDFVSTSDERLKTNFIPLTSNMELQPYWFQWIETGEWDIGFKAQDFVAHHPEAVSIVPTDALPDQLNISPRKVMAIIAAQLNDALDRIRRLEGHYNAPAHNG